MMHPLAKISVILTTAGLGTAGVWVVHPEIDHLLIAGICLTIIGELCVMLYGLLTDGLEKPRAQV